MKIKMSRQLENFALQHGLSMEIGEKPSIDKNFNFYAYFYGAEVKKGKMLESPYGYGKTAEEAIRNYEQKISGQLIVIGAGGDSRKEVVAPIFDDEYYTMQELYEFRKVYSSALFNEWAINGKYDVHKSLKHHDGEKCFDGEYFIAVAMLPAGQISNHFELKDWDLFRCEDVKVAKYEFDGHTPKDVIDRILALNKNKSSLYEGNEK